MKSHMFPNNLTPQREHLLKTVCHDIKKGKLKTECLQLALIHLREVGASTFLTEWGHSIAHAKRERGWLWCQALQIWATHLYYELKDRQKEISLGPLPIDIYATIKSFLEQRPQRQLENETKNIFGFVVPRNEALQILEHMYVRGGAGDFKNESAAFMFLRSNANDHADELFVRWLVLHCEEEALAVPPISMLDIVGEFENALEKLGFTPVFDDKARRYLELHFLVCFHNTLLRVDDQRFFRTAGIELPQGRQAMICANAYSANLGLYVGFFAFENGQWLEPDNIRTGTRFERYYYPLVQTTLSDEEFLIEPDENIRACLYNHPLKVRQFEGNSVLVALERNRCRFPPAPFRLKRTMWPKWLPSQTSNR